MSHFHKPVVLNAVKVAKSIPCENTISPQLAVTYTCFSFIPIQVSIRICDINQSKLGEKAVALVLPVLLENGINSRVGDVRAIRYLILVLC